MIATKSIKKTILKLAIFFGLFATSVAIPTTPAKAEIALMAIGSAIASAPDAILRPAMQGAIFVVYTVWKKLGGQGVGALAGDEVNEFVQHAGPALWTGVAVAAAVQGIRFGMPWMFNMTPDGTDVLVARQRAMNETRTRMDRETLLARIKIARAAKADPNQEVLAEHYSRSNIRAAKPETQLLAD